MNTARGYGGEISRGVLTLARLRADSEMVVRQSIHGPRNVWRPLTGRYETTARGQTYWRVAEVLTGGLSIGCVDCMDASPTWYSIVAVTPDGFVGRWVDYQSGIAIAVDGHGRRLPNPEGFYCARRVESSARATKRIDSSHPKLR